MKKIRDLFGSSHSRRTLIGSTILAVASRFAGSSSALAVPRCVGKCSNYLPDTCDRKSFCYHGRYFQYLRTERGCNKYNVYCNGRAQGIIHSVCGC